MLTCDLVALYLRHAQAIGLHGAEARAERERTLGWFVEVFGTYEAETLKPFHLTDWIESHERWRSVSTRRSKANVVRAAFQWAAAGERIARNPFSSVRYAEAERRPELPDDLLDRIASLGNKPFERAVRFLRLTGCRLGELCAARWADVDLERGEWTIHRHKSRRFTCRCKVVALVPGAVVLLRQMAFAETSWVGTQMAEESKALGAQPIFVNTLGRPWNRRTLGQTLRRIKRRYGITERATLHGIRHRMASAAIGAGASVKLVAEQLGHSSTIITERYYFHRSPDQLAAIRAAVSLGLP